MIRLFCWLLICLSMSCSSKLIDFDLEYNIDDNYIKVEDNELVITSFPLYFQANAENNYTKKSQVKQIQLVKIQCDLPFENATVQAGKNWTPIECDTEKLTENRYSSLHYLNCDFDFIPIFQEDKLTLRLKLSSKTNRLPENIKLTFRLKGKQHKTNVQYRILA